MRTSKTTLRNFWRSALVFGVIALIAMGWLLNVPLSNAALEVPQVLNYQARLTDDNRITVDDATLAMQFTLYDALTSGTCKYVAGGTCGTPTTVNVSTVDGVFTVPIGDGTLTNTFGDELFDDEASLYLEVQIAGETLTPRRQLTSAAYAMHAADSALLDSLNSDNDGCTAGCIVAGDANGNVVVTGAPQSSLAAGSVLYINPATPASDESIFGVANNGTAIFKIDEDGDIVRIGSSTVTDTVDQTTSTITNNSATTNDVMVISATGLTSGDALQITTGAGDSAINVAVGDVTFNDNLTVTGLTMLDGTSSTPDSASGDGDLFVDDTLEVDGVLRADGDVDLGDATGDTITATGRFDSSLVPSADDTYDLGTDALRWQDAYIGAESIHLGTAVGDELHLSYDTASNDLLFTLGAAGTVDFEITDDGHIGFSNTSATDTDTLVFTDTYDSLSSGTATRNGVLSTATFSNNTVTSGEHLYNGYKNTITADGIDNDTKITGYSTDITLTNTAPGSPNSEYLIGVRADVDISDGTSKYDSATLFSGSTVHNGAGTSTSWNGSDNTLAVTGGTITAAKGFSGLLTADGGSITTAQGASIAIVNNGGGTITDAIGLSLDVSSATSDNVALYVASGGVHVDDGSFSGAPNTAATFTGIGGDGTLFVKKGIEIYDGALCVGGATTCASASGSTAGQIYADGAINANDFDLAEMFESTDYLVAGEIVSVDSSQNETVKRAEAGDYAIGIVSTEPGLVLGWGGDNQYPIALAGRVPVKVSDENGVISIGDRVALGSTAGVGKKATEAGDILGIAMQPSNGGQNDAIIIFIQPQHWDGDQEAPASVTSQEVSPVVKTNNILVVSDNAISNIDSLRGAFWNVDSEGVFTTNATYNLSTKGHQNKDVVTHAITGLENYITMVGTTELEGNSITVEFEDIDPEFNDVIEAGAPIFVTATMSNGSGYVYITDKSMNGFTINRGGGDGTEVDWSVTAFRNGYLPEDDDKDVVEEEVGVDDEVDDGVGEEGSIVDENEVDESDEDPVDQDSSEGTEGEIIDESPVDDPVVEPVDEDDSVTDSGEDPVEVTEASSNEEVASPAEEDAARNDEPAVEGEVIDVSNEDEGVDESSVDDPADDDDSVEPTTDDPTVE